MLYLLKRTDWGNKVQKQEMCVGRASNESELVSIGLKWRLNLNEENSVTKC